MTTTTHSSERQILILIAANALFGFAIGFSSPSVAPLVVALGVSISFVGQAQTVSSLSATFLRLPMGVAMDRLGKKPFIILGGLVTFAGFVSYSAATFPLLLGAGIVLVTLDFAIRGMATTAALGEATRPGKLGRIYSIDLGVVETAATVAPLLGGYVGTGLGMPLSFIFATSAVLVTVAVLVVILGYRPPARTAESVDVKRAWFARPERELWPLIAIVTLDAAVWRMSFPFWALYIFKEMSAIPSCSWVALAISAGIPAVTAITLSGKLDKLGSKPFMALSEWAAIGAFMPLLLGSTPEFAYLSAIFWGLVYSLWVPAINAHVVAKFGHEKFGQTMGTMSLISGLASAASPAIAGWLWDNISPKAPFTITLIGAIAIGFVVWFKIQEVKKR